MKLHDSKATVNEALILHNIIEEKKLHAILIPSLPEIKVYKRRWLMLALFVLFAISNSLHIPQYNVISNIISRYYGVSMFAIEWLTITYMITYLILQFPASYLLNRVGLRWTCIIACTGTCIGTWIKVLSVPTDRFILTFVGHVIVACCQIFVFTIPACLSACWFGPKQTASASVICSMGFQLGIAISVLVVPMIVKNRENVEDIADDLSILFKGNALFSTLVTVIFICFFENEPKLPPSEARALQKFEQYETQDFWKSVKRILRNRNFLFLWNYHGILVGTMLAFNTFLNTMYLAHFKDGEEAVGRIGLASLITGCVGSVLLSLALDRTDKIKLVTLLLYITSLIGEIIFAVALYLEIKWLIYCGILIIGTGMIGYASTGCEVCSEMTYPESEGMSTGILSMATQVYGMIIILLSGKMIEIYGEVAEHVCFSLFLTLGIVLLAFTKVERRKQEAVKNIIYYKERT